MKNCSLVISTYNWPKALDVCLLSVMNQSHLPTEIIIADDGSDENTSILIKDYQQRYPTDIVHVWHEDLGFRKSIIMNKAIKQAKHDYIVQIDGDIILHRHFVRDHLVMAEKNCFVRGTRSHITQPFVQEVLNNRKINFGFYSKGVKNRFNAIRLPFLSWIMTQKEHSGRNVRGCNMAFWKGDFMSVNGYNNDLKGWGHEDEELATRMVNNGVIKKSVKFRCVQFHIHHKISSRFLEHQHDSVLEEVRHHRTLRTEYGYDEV